MNEEHTYLCPDCGRYFNTAAKARWFSSIKCPHCNGKHATPIALSNHNPRKPYGRGLGSRCGSKSGFS